ncbi:uncharacterized protein LOC132713178 [Ruditapes philippinarum]|uniref:uncharacterized protein LOC132713178 n=1 Tax=Ruditapes philippinarum TaxID=129788 RepID=UPI00295BA2CD|nr:uncharacterized protein LOC132713178 [Ruditapes philippinarum]
MCSEKNQGFFNTLKCKFDKCSMSKSKSVEDVLNLKSVKTVADYIHDNELRLKSCRVPTQNMRSKSCSSTSSTSENLAYVFEKVKHKTIPQFVSFEAKVPCEKYEKDKYALNYMLDNFQSEIRPRTFSMPTQNTYTKPVRRDSQRLHLNIEKHLNADINTKKPTLNQCRNVPGAFDSFFEEEIRTRTSSMPTTSSFDKPRVQHLRYSHQNLYARPALEIHTVRFFELNNKGKIVKRSESRSTRSSTSELSVDDFILESENANKMTNIDKEGYNIYVRGIEGVGKTALMQQFLTTQYLGGFDTSHGKKLSL